MLNGIFKKFASALLIAALLVSCLSFNLVNAKAASQGTVNASVLNVREQASTYSKILGKLKNKDVVTVNKVTGNWTEITYKSKKAYVYSQYLTLSNQAVAKTMSPTVSNLNVRAGASTYDKIIGKLTYGDIVNVVPEGKWGYYISNSKKHYVYLPYMKVVSTASNVQGQVSEETFKGKVTASKLNIRSSADTYSPVIGTFSQNQIITYNESNSKWGEVTVNNKKGYVFLTYVQKITEKSKMQTTASALNIRQLPDTNSPIIGRLTPSNVVEVENVNSKWGKISWNGKVGYIYLEYMKKAQTSVTQPAETAKTGYVTASSLNVRKTSNTTSSVIGSLSKGTAVSILKVENNMGKINYKNSTGYVSMNYISYNKPSTTPTQTQPQQSYKYVVTAGALNVRNEPSTAGKIIGKASEGQELQYIQNVNSDWMKIKFNNQNAYVSAQYVKKTSENDNNENTTIYGSLKGKTIMLDAGHGGKDSGTVGNGLYEKDITLDMVNRVKSKLQKNGVNVLLTRTSDVFWTLSERTNASNASNANAFVSIHANSSVSSSARGVETFYYSNPNTSLKNNSSSLATNILNELLQVSNMPSRGVKTANFQVIKYNKKPSTLIELGFVSNPNDASILKDNNYRNKAAEAIVEGLAKHFN